MTDQKIVTFTLNCTEFELNDKIRQKFIDLGFNLKTTKFDTDATGPSFNNKDYLITAYPTKG